MAARRDVYLAYARPDGAGARFRLFSGRRAAIAWASRLLKLEPAPDSLRELRLAADAGAAVEAVRLLARDPLRPYSAVAEANTTAIRLHLEPSEAAAADLERRLRDAAPADTRIESALVEVPGAHFA